MTQQAGRLRGEHVAPALPADRVLGDHGAEREEAPVWIMLRTPKPSTTTHSQVVAQKKRPALAELGDGAVGALACARAAGSVTGTRSRAASSQVSGVDGEGPPRARP